MPSLSLTKGVAQKEGIEMSPRTQKRNIQITHLDLDKKDNFGFQNNVQNNGNFGGQGLNINAGARNDMMHNNQFAGGNLTPTPQFQNQNQVANFQNQAQFNNFGGNINDRNLNQVFNTGIGTFGGGSFVEQQAVPSNINARGFNTDALKVMAQIIQQQFNEGRIRSIFEYFAPFDAHEQRTFEAWELPIIFQNKISLGDAEYLINSHGKILMGKLDITYQSLIYKIQMQVQMPPGIPLKVSNFSQKPRDQLTYNYISKIFNALQQSGRSLDAAFDIHFTQSSINQNEFQQFLSRIQIGMLQPTEINQLYSYFILGNEYQPNKIGFIQGLKFNQSNPLVPLQQFGNSGSLMNNHSADFGLINRNNIPLDGRVSPPLTSFKTATSFDSIQTSSFAKDEHYLIIRIVNSAKNLMQISRSPNFVTLLNYLQIPYTMYLEQYVFEDFCRKINVVLSPAEMNTVVNILGQDQIGKVKTEVLKNKIEGNSSLIVSPMTSPMDNYPPNINNPHARGGSAQYQHPFSGENLANPSLNNNQDNNLNFKQFQQSFGQANAQLMNQPQLYQQNNQFPLNQNNQFQQQPPRLQLDNPISFGPGIVGNQNINNPNIIGQGNFANGQNNMNPYTMDVKPALDKIRLYLQQINVDNIYYWFNTSTYNGKPVAELQEFLNFILSPVIKLSQQEAFQIANQSMMPPTPRLNYQSKKFIDLQKFEALIFQNQQGYQVKLELHKSQYVTMESIYDSIRKFIMINGGNIQQFFSDIDVNKDNFISQAELKMALQKFGHYNITDQEVINVFMFFDQNKDGRISYSELCQQFAEFSNTKAIKDPNHWAFYIFDNIRRACSSTQTPLADLFGLKGLNVQSLNQKYFITKEQFFRGLSSMKIHIYMDQERKLLELLDADQQNQNQIDFIHFAELVGIHYQPIQMQAMNQEYSKNPLQQVQRDKVKKFYRQLFGVLQSMNISDQNLQLIFRGSDIGNTGMIAFDEFIRLLRDLDYERKVDFSPAQEVCQKYLNSTFGGAPQINYKEFLSTLQYQNEKYQIINLIFITLQNEMSRLNLTQLYEVFKAHDRSGGLRQFDKDMLLLTLRAVGVQLNQYEVDMTIIEYDPDGRNGKLDFAAFEQDFLEFKKGQSALNGYFNKHQTNYLEFEKYVSGYQQPPQIKPLGGLVQTQARTPNALVQRLLESIGKFLDANQQYNIHQSLNLRGINQQGTLKQYAFLDLIQTDMMLSKDDAIKVYQHYDPFGSGEARIDQFLIDLKDKILNFQVRHKITELAQMFSYSLQPNAAPGVGGASSLERYSKGFQEVIKAITVRQSDTVSYFQNQVQGADRINKDIFRMAFINLGLQLLNPMDIDAIFDSLDTLHQGIIYISNIDQAIKTNCKLTGQQMQDEIMERLVRAFNGDDGFLLQKLMEYDRTSRGFIDIGSFTDFFIKNSPQHQQMSKIDIQFLGMKYINPRSANPNLIDINILLNDFAQIRQQRGIQRGDFSSMFQIQHKFQGSGLYETQYDQFGSGHRNPLLPQTSKTNTKAEINRMQPPMGYRMTLESHYLEEIAKGTYLQEKLVENYFKDFAQSNYQGVLQESDFANAIQRLNLGWVAQSTSQVFIQIDLAFHNQQQKRAITPEDIDKAVCFSSQKNINFRSEILKYDNKLEKQIRLDLLKHIIMDIIRAPQIMEIDVDFICKKYILNIPSVIPYERMLDDFEAITKSSFSNIGNSAVICEYIKKGVIVEKLEMIEFFQKFMRKRDFISIQDIQNACAALKLVPSICNNEQIENLFYDVDNSGVQETKLERFTQHVLKIAYKQTRELQDSVLAEIASRIQGKNIIIDNIFKQDDIQNKGYVSNIIFQKVLGQQLQVKEIDAKLLGMRYEQTKEYTNYVLFIKDVKLQSMNVKPLNTGQNGGAFPLVQVGLNTNNATGNNPQQNRLKEILIQISEIITKRGISLYQELTKYERGQATGTINYNQFLQTLSQILTLPSNDLAFLGDIYTIPQQNNLGGQPQIDYRKFLADIKMQQNNMANKFMTTLTKEQKSFYKKMSDYMKQKNLTHKMFENFLEKDFQQKYYLPQQTIQEVVLKNEFKMNEQYFNIFFSALDRNSHNEYSYKQIFEIMLGEEDAQKLFQGGLVSKGIGARSIQGVNFIMPQQPIGAMNPTMDSIGRMFILSNINYEEEFKKKMAYSQQNSPNPKVVDKDIYDVIAACNIQLNTDQRSGLFDFMMMKQDQERLIPILDFLQAVGLPAQTIGPKGQKSLPKRILNPQELQQAQDMINKIRDELNKMQKRPQDIFDGFKSNQGDLTLPVVRFKQALAQIGNIGRAITEEQITLLQYYLAQEVPNEISFKKMYLAFTYTDKDPPLKQEGADEIRQYQKKLTEHLDKGIPIEILDLQDFMRQNQLSIEKVIKQNKGFMTRQEFETALKESGYVPNDMQKLIKLLDTKGNMQSVNIDRLYQFIQKAMPALAQRKITQKEARDRYDGFDPKVRFYMQKISDFMKKQNYTISKMYEQIDINRDGTVEKQEFVTKLTYLDIPGVQMSDLGMIFDAMDINNDGNLSINEFALFIEGAQATRLQRSNELDPALIAEMRQQIDALFQQFDDNGDGFVTCDEIQKAMLALGQRITLDDARNLISPIDTNGDGKLDRNEFQDLMLPKMKEELLSQEESLEDLRSMFLDADIDHSGTLSIDEIYSVILKLGAKVSEEELIQLMNEIDVDRNGSLDIDEFIALMSLGDEMQFRSSQSKNTFMSIKRAKKLGAADFFKNFKNLPGNFVPSFFTEKWVKYKKNLPSSVFIPQIDPKTMLYKDLFPVLKENLKATQNLVQFQPRVRPLATQLGCEILLDEAQGVPMPASSQSFNSKTQLVKRMVRVGLYDTIKKDFIQNAVQVNALYNEKNEDIWKFNALRDNGTNPVLFKSSNKDDMIKPNIFMIFELSIAVLYGEKVQEISCGWCKLEMDKLDRPMTHKLPIKGGSPSAEMLIKDSDIHKGRTGMKYIMKAMQSKIESQLTISIRPFQKFTEETQLHMDLLPSCCFIQKRLLYFVSGFRNYIGEKLLKESAMIHLRQPEGDIIISCFPKILDNPDICEQIIHIWSEDVWSGLNQKQKQNIDLIMMKTQDFIKRLYPVIYADEFHFKESDYTMSAAGNQSLLRKREELIKSALCFGNNLSKIKVDKPLEALTSFKPFTVRELEFEVWDTKSAKQDRYMRQYEELGLIQNQSNNVLTKDSSLIQNMNRPQQNQQFQGQPQQLQINNNIQINRGGNPGAFGGMGGGIPVGQFGAPNNQPLMQQDLNVPFQNQNMGLPLSLQDRMNQRFN